jgi:anti-anti-sigma factor
MLDIREARHADRVLLELVGSIDFRSAFAFDRKTAELLQEGLRLFAVDLAAIDVLTSAGIREFVRLDRLLKNSNGALVLCGVTDQAKRVLAVSGLLEQFTVETSRDAALARLVAEPAPVAAAIRTSKLADFSARLLRRSGDSIGLASIAPVTDRDSALAQHVVRILESPQTPDPGAE